MNKIYGTTLAARFDEAFDINNMSAHKIVYYNLFNGNLHVISKKNPTWYKFWLKKVPFKLLLEKKDDIYNHFQKGNSEKLMLKCRSIYCYISNQIEKKPKNCFTKLIHKITNVSEILKNAKAFINDIEKDILNHRKATNKKYERVADYISASQLVNHEKPKLPEKIEEPYVLPVQSWMDHYTIPQKVNKNDWDKAPVGSYRLENEDSDEIEMIIKGLNGDIKMTIRTSHAGLNLYQIRGTYGKCSDQLCPLSGKKYWAPMSKTLSELSTFKLVMVETIKSMIPYKDASRLLLSLGYFRVNKDQTSVLCKIQKDGSISSDEASNLASMQSAREQILALYDNSLGE